MPNPYSAMPLVGTEAEEHEQTVITNLDGVTVLGAEQGSQVVVDASGRRLFHGVRRLVRGPDLRVVTNPAETFACACGRQLLSIHAVVFCAVCQYSTCRTCAKEADDGTIVLVLCACCYEHGKWLRLIKRWLTRAWRFVGWLAKI